jgi:flagellar basal-body rod protein FlgC
MTMFGAMNAAGSGLATYQTWLDALADNIANINTVEPMSGKAFQAEYVQAQAIAGGQGQVGSGVEVAGINLSSAQGRVTYDPQSPQADSTGYVRLPDIDLGEQMGELIMAQRAFQANAAVVTRAQDSYQSAIDIGKKA